MGSRPWKDVCPNMFMGYTSQDMVLALRLSAGLRSQQVPSCDTGPGQQQRGLRRRAGESALPSPRRPTCFCTQLLIHPLLIHSSLIHSQLIH